MLEGVQDCNQEAMSAIVPTMGTSMPAYGGIGAGVPSYGGFGAGFGGVGMGGLSLRWLSPLVHHLRTVN